MNYKPELQLRIAEVYIEQRLIPNGIYNKLSLTQLLVQLYYENPYTSQALELIKAKNYLLEKFPLPENN